MEVFCFSSYGPMARTLCSRFGTGLGAQTLSSDLSSDIL